MVSRLFGAATTNFFLGGSSDNNNNNNNNTDGLLEGDVICTQNRRALKHPGNVRYQEILKQHREAYLNAKRKDHKTSITRTVIQQVKNEGGRFVKFANGWVELDATAEREKVSHALRSTNQQRGKRNSRLAEAKAATAPVLSSADSSSSQGADFRRIFLQQQSLFEQSRDSASSISLVPETAAAPLNQLPSATQEPVLLKTTKARQPSLLDLFRSASHGELSDFISSWAEEEEEEDKQKATSTACESSKATSPKPCLGKRKSTGGLLLEPLDMFKSMSFGLMQEFAESWVPEDGTPPPPPATSTATANQEKKDDNDDDAIPPPPTSGLWRNLSGQAVDAFLKTWLSSSNDASITQV